MNESEKLMILSNNFKRLIDMVNNGFTGIPNFSDEFISDNNISSIETFDDTKQRLEREFHILMLGGINNDINPIETYYTEPETPVESFKNFYFMFDEGYDVVFMSSLHTIIEVCAYNPADARRIINNNVYFKIKNITLMEDFTGLGLNKPASGKVNSYGDYNLYSNLHLRTVLDFEKKILDDIKRQEIILGPYDNKKNIGKRL